MANSTPPLVTVQWLNGELKTGKNDLKIFDTSIGLEGLMKDQYEKEHIAGAQLLNLFHGANRTQFRPVDFPDSSVFQEYAQSLGINQNTHVILYDNIDEHGFSGPRMWWTFRVFGHDRVSVLDGGLKRWKAEGYSVTSDATSKYPKGDFQVHLRQDLIAEIDDVLPGKRSSEMQVVDARHGAFFGGQEKEPSSLLQLFAPALGLNLKEMKIQTGHIPGSRNIPYPTVYREDDKASFQDVGTLKSLFEKARIKLDEPLTCTCYVGLTACQVALAAALCGKFDVKVYRGSWVEYGQTVSDDQVEVP